MRLLQVRDQNALTSGPTPCWVDDDDNGGGGGDDDDDSTK
jgi:hypothetical protein